MTLEQDLYKRRLNTYDVGTENNYVKPIQKSLEMLFKNVNPSYKKSAIVNGESTGALIIDSDAGNKTIIRRPSEILSVGNIVEWNGYWLCIEVDRDDIYPKGVIEYCSNIIRWKDETNSIIEQPILYGDLSKYSMGTNEEKLIVIGDSSKLITIQSNINTLKLKRDFRLMVGRKIYKITDIDEVELPGLLKIKMVEDQIFNEKDDFENGIAYNDLDEVVETSSIRITGDDSISKSYSSSYKCKKLDNEGNIIAGTFTFTVENISITPNSAYALNIIDGNNCEITCNEFMDDNYNLYSIKLIATDDSDGSNVCEKIIEFRG